MAVLWLYFGCVRVGQGIRQKKGMPINPDKMDIHVAANWCTWQGSNLRHPD